MQILKRPSYRMGLNETKNESQPEEKTYHSGEGYPAQL